MKTTTILTAAAAAIMLTSGAALAHPGKGHGGPGYKSGYSHQVKHHRGVTPAQRAAVARSAANLAALKRRAWRDGRLSALERVQIRNAERRHAALVQRVYRR